MLKRVLTGTVIVVLIAGFLSLRLIDTRLFDVFLWGMAIIGTFELQRAFKDKTNNAQKTFAVIFSATLFPVAVFFPEYIFVVFIVFVALNLLALVIDYEASTVEGVIYTVFSGLYPNMFLILLHYLNVEGHHFSDLILAFAVLPVVDTMAFFTGSLFKGKKLCPLVSPNKTVSGAIGGLIGGVITSLAVYFIFYYAAGNVIFNLPADICFYTMVGIMCGILGEVGDLVESGIKRKLGVKDMGKLLPGHGGVLDRIDGLMFAAVGLYICFCVIL